jgi:type I restriction enzyme M protein
MIDASKGFMKDGNKNRLREQDIHKIVDTFTKQTNTPRYARMVPFDEIRRPKTITTSTAALHRQYRAGGHPGHRRPSARGNSRRDINALDAYWQVIPGVRQGLFESAGRPGYSRLKSPISTVKSAILSHSEFTAFKTTVTKIFDQWRTTNTPALKGFNKEGHPKR